MSDQEKRILIPCKDGYVVIKKNNICVVEAYEGMARLFLCDGTHICISKSLSLIKNKLGDNTFFRVNRKYIVNKEYVSKLEKWFNYDFVVKMRNTVNLKIVLNKKRVPEFVEWIEA